MCQGWENVYILISLAKIFEHSIFDVFYLEKEAFKTYIFIIFLPFCDHTIDGDMYAKVGMGSNLAKCFHDLLNRNGQNLMNEYNLDQPSHKIL